MFRFSTLVLGLSLFPALVNAQGWKASIQRIQQAANPSCDKKFDEACSVMFFSQQLSNGLNGQWASQAQKAQPVPAEYLRNLASLADQLETAAAKAPSNGPPPKELTETFAFVGKDLEAKYKDCLTYGMSRLLAVKLRTIRADNTIATGWEVLYRCTLNTGLSGAELQAPGLTETVAQLPPAAVCIFHARKAGQEAFTEGIPVFGKDAITVDIRVP